MNKAEFNTPSGTSVIIDFDEVECYRGETLGNGEEGTRVYFEDNTDVLLDARFNEVLAAERAKVSEYK